MSEKLFYCKQGGAVKKVNAAKAKKLVHEGYEIGSFVKGKWVPAAQTDVSKQNVKLKAENKNLLAELKALKGI